MCCCQFGRLSGSFWKLPHKHVQPLLDGLCSHLDYHFGELQQTAPSLMGLIPAYIADSLESLQPAIDMHSELLPSQYEAPGTWWIHSLKTHVDEARESKSSSTSRHCTRCFAGVQGRGTAQHRGSTSNSSYSCQLLQLIQSASSAKQKGQLLRSEVWMKRDLKVSYCCKLTWTRLLISTVFLMNSQRMVHAE